MGIVSGNMLSHQLFSAQNAANIVQQPGSARSRWESLQHSPNLPAG